jgi:hypothetical protein
VGREVDGDAVEESVFKLVIGVSLNMENGAWKKRRGERQCGKGRGR